MRVLGEDDLCFEPLLLAQCGQDIALERRVEFLLLAVADLEVNCP